MKADEATGTWRKIAVKGHYRAGAATEVDDTSDFAIEGLVPRVGVSVWFGPGSTGKTQMLLWMAAHLAAPKGDRPESWLGAAIRKRGHILVVSAEDIREHIYLRLAGIGNAMKEQHPRLDVEALCNRIHVIPFLSLDDNEFPGENPRLFRDTDTGWEASDTLEGIEEFITAWNHEDRPQEDRIIGVILDSAVSMAGFELTNSDATTALLFRLNRNSLRQGVFWAVIGHTPKSAEIRDGDPLNGAAERLRGSAMWSTTPRSVVELRLAGPTENLQDLQEAFPNLGRRDIVIANVVKSNLKDSDWKPRVLRRLSEGAYHDLTREYPNVCRSWDPSSPSPTLRELADRERVLVKLIRELVESKSDKTVSYTKLRSELKARSSDMPSFKDVIFDAKKDSANNPNTLAHLLRRLKAAGHIRIDQRKIEVLNVEV